MSNPMQQEPAITAGMVMALVYIAAAFGLPVSEDQKRALQDNLPVVLPMIAILVGWMRQMVYAPDTVKRLEAAAFLKGVRAVDQAGPAISPK